MKNCPARADVINSLTDSNHHPLLLFSVKNVVLAAAGKTVLRPGGRAATEQLLQWANFQPGKTVLELASGLENSAIALAKRYGVQVVGIEKDPDRVAIDQASARSTGLEQQVQFIQGNIFQLEVIYTSDGLEHSHPPCTARSHFANAASPGSASTRPGLHHFVWGSSRLTTFKRWHATMLSPPTLTEVTALCPPRSRKWPLINACALRLQMRALL